MDLDKAKEICLILVKTSHDLTLEECEALEYILGYLEMVGA